jgi:hypothetical protein
MESSFPIVKIDIYLEVTKWRYKSAHPFWIKTFASERVRGFAFGEWPLTTGRPGDGQADERLASRDDRQAAGLAPAGQAGK